MINKKGESLPLNTVVVAVLVIIVLVVVVIFFLGGMGGMTSKIKSMFFGTLAGTDRAIAVQTCQTRCEQAMFLPDPKSSAYCTSPFYIDDNNDGEADKTTDGNYIKWSCYLSAKWEATEEHQSLGVECLKDGKQIIC
jgi:hypothetical protein